MNISAKTEYACVAMLELAANYGSDEPVPIPLIAEKHGLPDRFLVLILLELKAAGLVASTRGWAGGYHMVRPPAEVSLGQVMDVIQGPSSSGPSGSPDSPAVKALMKAWHDVTTEVQGMLGKISLAELLHQAKQEDQQTYYI